jgi:hypothetical protein
MQNIYVTFTDAQTGKHDISDIGTVFQLAFPQVYF